MQSKLFKEKFHPLLVPILLGVGFLGAGVGAIMMTTHMDIPTFAASLSTKQVKVTDLQQSKLKTVVLIDVRTPEEHARDHIEPSILVPLDDITLGIGVKRIQAIAASTQQNPIKPTLVLYCTSGQRSVKAYKQLESLGLDFVVLTGGIKEWRRHIPANRDVEVLSTLVESR